MSIPFPNIDPVALSIGPVAIRWYALAYMAGILIGWWYLLQINKKEPVAFTKKALDDIVVWTTAGIILGGRIGYVVFYNPSYYLSDPVEALKIWHGGMSFHGGMAGLALAIFMLCRRENVPFLRGMDLVACVAPIGIFFGRLANFINGELYGRVTDVPWGMVFPNGGPLPRHPSQLYQAGLEGLLVTIVLAIAVQTSLRLKAGALSGLFLIMYAFSRIVMEFFRQPDAQLGFIFGQFTMGQLLSVPMALLGVYLVCRKTHVA